VGIEPLVVYPEVDDVNLVSAHSEVVDYSGSAEVRVRDDVVSIDSCSIVCPAPESYLCSREHLGQVTMLDVEQGHDLWHTFQLGYWNRYWVMDQIKPEGNLPSDRGFSQARGFHGDQSRRLRISWPVGRNGCDLYPGADELSH
jgi:hypothetical protein